MSITKQNTNSFGIAPKMGLPLYAQKLDTHPYEACYHDLNDQFSTAIVMCYHPMIN